VRQHVDGSRAWDSALLREQHAFREREHLDGEAQVARNLHHERETVLADVRHLGPDVVQDRFDPVEGRLAAADHHRESALLESHDAA